MSDAIWVSVVNYWAGQVALNAIQDPRDDDGEVYEDVSIDFYYDSYEELKGLFNVLDMAIPVDIVDAVNHWYDEIFFRYARRDEDGGWDTSGIPGAEDFAEIAGPLPEPVLTSQEQIWAWERVFGKYRGNPYGFADQP